MPSHAQHLLDQIAVLPKSFAAISIKNDGTVSNDAAAAQRYKASQNLLTEGNRLITNFGAVLAPVLGSEAATDALTAFDIRRQEVANKLFAVPELLETILLSGLSIKDVFACMQFNKTFRGCISGSVELQRHLHLIPDPNAYYTSIFDRTILGREFPLLDTAIIITTLTKQRGQEYPYLNNSSSIFSATFPHNLPRRIGSRFKDLLVCQPPVTKLKVTLRCCNFGFQGTHQNPLVQDGEDYVIEVSTGITVGHVYDTTMDFHKSHRHCPLAPAARMRQDGNVRVGVTFSSIISVRDDDPVVDGYKAEMDEKAAEQKIIDAGENEDHERAVLLRMYHEDRKHEFIVNNNVLAYEAWYEAYVMRQVLSEGVMGWLHG